MLYEMRTMYAQPHCLCTACIQIQLHVYSITDERQLHSCNVISCFFVFDKWSTGTKQIVS